MGSARLLLLVNYRPDYQHTWGSKTAYSQMRLDTLPAESAEELLERSSARIPGLLHSSNFSSSAGTRSSWRRPSERSWRRGRWWGSAKGIG
jgi:hypothetical protein